VLAADPDQEESRMHNDKTISTLNHLIETCKDGEEGFRTAAEGVSSPAVRAAFSEFSRQRGQMARELQQEVQGLGGSAETAGSMSGSLHRGWINIKAAVTGKDEHQIIAEAERGEDVAKKVFEDALKEPLPTQVLALVQRMAGQVRAAHDRVRDMEKATK
jgi:uncharacterized protein (TIGR02284 family)